MNIHKILNKTIATILFAVCFVTSAVSASASTNKISPKGDSDVVSEDLTIEKQFDELLKNSSSLLERQIILKKAHEMNISSESFNENVLSKTDLDILNGIVDIQTSKNNDKKIITNKSTKLSNEVRIQQKVTVAGVSMPDYALWPKIYKQATNTSCSAGTIYTVAKYIGAKPPKQANIMKFWKSKWGVTYPDLPLVRNYMNSYLPGKPSDYVPYVYKKYGGSQKTFNKDLKSNVLHYQPMILNIKNSSGKTNWPYTTNGHFCMCNGLLTWESNKYFIGDPFYFSSYVSGAKANNGELKRTWTQLNNVITNKFGSGSQHYLT